MGTSSGLVIASQKKDMVTLGDTFVRDKIDDGRPIVGSPPVGAAFNASPGKMCDQSDILQNNCCKCFGPILSVGSPETNRTRLDGWTVKGNKIATPIEVGRVVGTVYSATPNKTANHPAIDHSTIPRALLARVRKGFA